MTPDAGSLSLLRALHDRVFAVPEMLAVVDAAFEELARELREREEPPYATRVLDMGLFEEAVPLACVGEVRLCRAFLLLRGARMAVPEVHRNSVQRLVSYRGSGWIHQERAGGGRRGLADEGLQGPWGARPGDLAPRAIASPDPADPCAVPVERCWDIVPAGVWHFPEAGRDQDWATVTFHSASEEEIVDELWERA